jgi:hypothetical protein
MSKITHKKERAEGDGVRAKHTHQHTFRSTANRLVNWSIEETVRL